MVGNTRLMLLKLLTFEPSSTTAKNVVFFNVVILSGLLPKGQTFGFNMQHIIRFILFITEFIHNKVLDAADKEHETQLHLHKTIYEH